MIAARLHAYDAPMTLDRIEVPEPRPNDVLVEVKAYGVVPNLARVDLSRLEHRASPLSKVNEVLAGMHDRNGGFTNFVIDPTRVQGPCLARSYGDPKWGREPNCASTQ